MGKVIVSTMSDRHGPLLLIRPTEPAQLPHRHSQQTRRLLESRPDPS